MEAHGFKCWYYERDAQKGDNYTESVGRAIADASVAVKYPATIPPITIIISVRLGTASNNFMNAVFSRLYYSIRKRVWVIYLMEF